MYMYKRVCVCMSVADHWNLQDRLVRSWARNLSHPAFRLPRSRRNLRLNRLEVVRMYTIDLLGLLPWLRAEAVDREGFGGRGCMAGLAGEAAVAWGHLEAFYPSCMVWGCNRFEWMRDECLKIA